MQNATSSIFANCYKLMPDLTDFQLSEKLKCYLETLMPVPPGLQRLPHPLVVFYVGVFILLECNYPLELARFNLEVSLKKRAFSAFDAMIQL